ncbi:hypothetical protein BZL29_4652 [Mycobacterium kansasii]|uniref:Uncharacterized protein n=1 Tax=Mycobacterium kansasii TaxID=1768 RepID=A0A1V3X6D4_MYCKA|nr:hypothetical protein BZL29_4652 [Mycobacterium kansasii]
MTAARPELVALRHGLCAIYVPNADLNSSRPPAPPGDPAPTPRGHRQAPRPGNDPMPVPAARQSREGSAA